MLLSSNHLALLSVEIIRYEHRPDAIPQAVRALNAFHSFLQHFEGSSINQSLNISGGSYSVILVPYPNANRIGVFNKYKQVLALNMPDSITHEQLFELCPELEQSLEYNLHGLF